MLITNQHVNFPSLTVRPISAQVCMSQAATVFTRLLAFAELAKSGVKMQI
jgi:hypothetical protein